MATAKTTPSKNLSPRIARGIIGALPRGYDALRLFLALLLLTAAGLKAHQLATGPLLGPGLLESRWFLVAVVEFELFFGLWLISGLFSFATWCRRYRLLRVVRLYCDLENALGRIVLRLFRPSSSQPVVLGGT